MSETDAPLTDAPTVAAEEAAAPSLEARFVAAGHALLDKHMARGRELAVHYPAVRALLPVLEATLRELFAHLTTSPEDFAQHEAALAAAQEQNAAVVAPRNAAQAEAAEKSVAA